MDIIRPYILLYSRCGLYKIIPLNFQARSTSAISTRESSVSALKNCWEILKCENISFVTLVTGAFPPAKAQDSLLNELRYINEP